MSHPSSLDAQSLARGGAVASSLTMISWLWFWALSPLPKKMTCTVRSSLRNALLVHAWLPGVGLHLTGSVARRETAG